MNKPEIIARALGYPYDIRDHSFTLRNGKVADFDPADTAGRHPVIAVGSNRAPQQLKRKFGDAQTIPVQHARLDEHDVVYSAHVSAYGSVPATLRHVTGTAVDVGITWLTDAQLHIMHETELPNGNYDYVLMRGIALTTEGTTPTEAFVYQSKRGHLRSTEGTALALTTVRARQRRLPALSQTEAIEHVRAVSAPDIELAAFIHATATDQAARRRHIRTVQQTSLSPAHWPEHEVIRAR